MKNADGQVPDLDRDTISWSIRVFGRRGRAEFSRDLRRYAGHRTLAGDFMFEHECTKRAILMLASWAVAGHAHRPTAFHRQHPHVWSTRSFGRTPSNAWTGIHCPGFCAGSGNREPGLVAASQNS